MDTCACHECGHKLNFQDSETIANLVLNGRLLFVSALKSAVIFAYPVLWVVIYNALNEVIADGEWVAGEMVIYVSLFVWIGCPAFGWLIARDTLQQAMEFKIQRRGHTEHAYCAMAGMVMLRIMVYGPAPMIVLIATFVIYLATH